MQFSYNHVEKKKTNAEYNHFDAVFWIALEWHWGTNIMWHWLTTMPQVCKRTKNH